MDSDDATGDDDPVGEGILVPVSSSPTLPQTVAFAVGHVLEATGPGPPPRIHLVAANPYDLESDEGKRVQAEIETLLDRAAAWVREDAAGAPVTVETTIVGREGYLFAPRDYAEAFAAHADREELGTVVLDPEYRSGLSTPMLHPLHRELENLGVSVVDAPVERPAQHVRLTGTESFDRAFALFWVAFGFYLLLGDPLYWFDLVTGAVVAGIVSLTLSHVTFTFPLDRVRSPIRTIRFFALYVPYLLFEIVKANLVIALVILRPSMPIEPKLMRVEARVRSGLPLLALANSITLTPGTLTVRANDQRLLIHTLVPAARADLFDGRLERAVRFIFHGRPGMRIASPRERGEATVLGGEEE